MPAESTVVPSTVPESGVNGEDRPVISRVCR